MTCKIISWNVNGLNSPNKRKIVFHWLKKQKSDIVCLQETHVKKNDSRFLINKGLGLEFYSLSDRKVKGIVFYINKELHPKQIFSDSDGKYLAIEITYEGKKTLLLGIYAPNDAKEKYFRDIANKLRDTNYDQIFMLGDFNGVTDPKLDRSLKVKKNERGKLPKAFFELIDQENLVDIWRRNNGTAKEYTFFSSRHKTHSRIDMLWLSNNLISQTGKIEILPRIISDHNPIMWIGKSRKKVFIWRLNEDLLNSPKTLERIKKETKEYFDLNMDKGVKIQLVWDAYKAVIRGVLIKLNSEFKKKRGKKIFEIQELLRMKEQELKKNPGEKRIDLELKILKQQLEAILMEEVNKKIKYMQQRYFENADKPGRLLAWQLKEKRKKTIINKIKVNGKDIIDQEEIKNNFSRFFENLYKNSTVKMEEIQKYFQKLKLLKLMVS